MSVLKDWVLDIAVVKELDVSEPVEVFKMQNDLCITNNFLEANYKIKKNLRNIILKSFVDILTWSLNWFGRSELELRVSMLPGFTFQSSGRTSALQSNTLTPNFVPSLIGIFHMWLLTWK